MRADVVTVDADPELPAQQEFLIQLRDLNSEITEAPERFINGPPTDFVFNTEFLSKSTLVSFY
jgi:hypothetical protein